MVDTMPVFVAESLDKSSSSKTFQPKYGDNVFKLQVRVYCSDDADSDLGLQMVITLTGDIVGYTGLHWGVTPDNLMTSLLGTTTTHSSSISQHLHLITLIRLLPISSSLFSYDYFLLLCFSVTRSFSFSVNMCY